MVELPKEINLTPNHIGELGEALFKSMYGPPEPVLAEVQRLCEHKAPEWVDLEDVNIQSAGGARNRIFSVEKSNEELTWKADSWVNAFYHVPLDQAMDRDVPRRWKIKCPVEIKTGPNATTENDQRTVMEFLAENTEYCPMIVYFDIENLPESFTVSKIELFD